MYQKICKLVVFSSSVCLLTVGSGLASAAESLAFVSIEKARGLPIRGQSRSSVRNKFGEPESRKGAVGDPPISTWAYPEFIVYFEYNLVITTVKQDDHLPTKLGNL